MVCTSCSETTPSHHTGEWVCAKSSTETYGITQGALDVTVTETTYSDVLNLHIILCDKCLAAQARRSMRKTGLFLFSFIALLSLVVLLAMSSPQLGRTGRVITGAFLILTWAILLTKFGLDVRRLRRGEVNQQDESWMGDFALREARRRGRNSLFTLKEWHHVEEHSRKTLSKRDPRITRILGDIGE
jgi:hypothetical protein